MEIVETHISWVLLTPTAAYKLKKPVDLGFLDFSTPARRRQACEDELRLNRRLAAGIYIGVLPVLGTPEAPSLEGLGTPIDWVVHMHRFPPGALWSEALAQGQLLPAQMGRFAQRLAQFHAQAPCVADDQPWGNPAEASGPALASLMHIEQMRPGAAEASLGDWLRQQSTALAPVWAERRARGFVRECHGDLHLANIVTLGDDITAFDCIEFDPALRWIDVMNDTAFLVMDLWAHGRQDLAFRFLNAYLEQTGDYEGLTVLRFYLVYRAIVRAQIGLLQGRTQQPDYLSLATTIAASGDARLLATTGLPGSGKSHLAQLLIEATGGIRLRSDVERKRLHGLAPLDDSRTRGADIYVPDSTERTFARLRALARVSLLAGWRTVVDAASLKRVDRERFHVMARDLGVPFTLLACDAPPSVLDERVRVRERRRDDASEAGSAVLERLKTVREPLDAEERAHAIEVDTTNTPAIDGLASKWLSQLPKLTQPVAR